MSIVTDRPLLMDCRDVQRECRIGRDEALRIMHAAGAIRMGKGRGLRVRPADLDEHLQRLRDREAVG